MRWQRGHSLVEWSIIFSVLVLAIFFSFTTAKRGIISKAMHLTDRFVWEKWGNSVQNYGWDIRVESGSSFSGSSQAETREASGNITKLLNAESTTHATSSYLP
jgi:hypothetical protein